MQKVKKGSYQLKTSLQVNLKQTKLKTSKNTECLLRLGVLPCVCVVMCFIWHGPFCHGALKRDMPLLFTTFLL